MKIREATLSDAPRICEIYNYYILNTTITFDTEALTDDAIAQRIRYILRDYPFWVCEDEGQVVGYGYLNAWRLRKAYYCTAELSVYVDRDYRGLGIGELLMRRLVSELDEGRLHVIVSCITLPNDASIAVHKKFGFEQVGVFREVGYKFGQWRDVSFWQLRGKDISTL